MKVGGNLINDRGMDLNDRRMEILIKEDLNMVKHTERVYLNGRTEIIMMENGLWVLNKVKENGLLLQNLTKDHGLQEKPVS